MFVRHPWQTKRPSSPFAEEGDEFPKVLRHKLIFLSFHLMKKTQEIEGFLIGKSFDAFFAESQLLRF